MNSTVIDTTAVVHPDSEIGEGVEIGPYSVVEKGTVIGDETVIGPHCVVHAGTTIGKRNQFTSFVSVGSAPQDQAYGGTESFLEIGDDNIFREYVSLNRGTPKEESVTRIGNQNMMMAGCHVGHDAVVGNKITMANCALLGGHVHVGDGSYLSAFIPVVQFTSIGRMAYVGASSRVVQDVPPFVKVAGDPAEVRMVNEIGMQRFGIDEKDIDEIKHVYRTIFRRSSSVLEEAHGLINDDSPLVRELAGFLVRKEAGRFGRYRESLRAG